MNIIKRVFQNSAIALATNLVTKSANALAFILIARMAGLQQAGIFSLGTTYLAIFFTATLGLDELLVRQVARDRTLASQYLGVFLLFKLLLSVLSYAILVLIVLNLADYSPTTSAPIILLGLCMIPDSLSSIGQALLIAHERFGTSMLAGSITGLFRIVGVGAAMLNNAGINTVVWVWIIGSILGSIVNLFGAVQQSRSTNFTLQPARSFWIENLKLSGPFLSIGILLALEYQIDVVILSILRDEREVSVYTAATTIFFALILMVQSFRNAIYPIMVHYQKSSSERLNQVYNVIFSLLGALSLPMATGLALLSPAIITGVYTDEFVRAVLPLQIISWGLVFYYLNVPNVRMMLIQDRQKTITIFQIGSLLVNVLLNLLLDTRLGAAGASIARLVATFIFFLPNYLYVTRYFLKHNLLQSLAKPGLAVIIMASGVWLSRNLSLWLSIPTGIILYLVTFISVRGITKEERVWLKDQTSWE